MTHYMFTYLKIIFENIMILAYIQNNAKSTILTQNEYIWIFINVGFGKIVFTYLGINWIIILNTIDV